MNTCQSCRKSRQTRTAIVNGKYYKHICDSCIGNNDDSISSNAAGYERRRGYEDHAHETLQPYDANGPNAEFARLYPGTAKKVFGDKLFNDLRRKI